MTPLPPGPPGPDPTAPISENTRKHLTAVRSELLHLHKAILNTERAAYEREKGKVESPHVLLQLVMHDPWFGWFRPLSEMAVQIDELLDPFTPQGEVVHPATEAEAQELLRELRSLIAPAEHGEEFATRYHAILQQDPNIIMAHAKMSNLLQV